MKKEQNHMKFSELFVLLLEKGLVRNSFGLKFYLDNYNKAIEEEIEEEKKVQEITTDLRQMKKIQEEAKEWINFLKNVGRLYFHGQKNPIEKYLEQILFEIPSHRKKSATQSSVFYRVLNYDETNKKVLNEITIEAILNFEEDLKRLFTAYMAENYEKQNIVKIYSDQFLQFTSSKIHKDMLTWEEIDMLNKKMSTISILRLLVDSNIIPQVISAEQFQDIQIRIVVIN